LNPVVLLSYGGLGYYLNVSVKIAAGVGEDFYFALSFAKNKPKVLFSEKEK
jgi:hypothetical protein